VIKKLTEYDVRLIRRVVQKRNRVMRELSNKSIARRLNVSVGTIRNVVKGARWGWVE